MSTTQSSKYGTKVVGGVTPGKGSQSVAETFNRSSIARASIVFLSSS
jgi:succinyl-CoA synthetase alpha subunit